MTEHSSHECTIPPELASLRVDQALAKLFPAYSRARLQKWIKGGHVTLDGCVPRGRDAVSGGEQVIITPVVEERSPYQAERLPLQLIHEDDELLVVNKPPGLVVHPAAGNWDGTLLNGLLDYDPRLTAVPRAGIVHRLDKDTSGLMVVARSIEAHKQLVAQLQRRTVKREYLALVRGELIAGGAVEGNVGRHPVDRKRMAVVQGGKPAVTHYRIEARYRDYTLLRVRLETGRTHQIRVHMAHIQHPVVGDPVYGGRLRLPRGADNTVVEAVRAFPRQALHAGELALEHPVSGETLSWHAPLPDDMQRLLETLAQ